MDFEPALAVIIPDKLGDRHKLLTEPVLMQETVGSITNDSRGSVHTTDATPNSGEMEPYAGRWRIEVRFH